MTATPQPPTLPVTNTQPQSVVHAPMGFQTIDGVYPQSQFVIPFGGSFHYSDVPAVIVCQYCHASVTTSTYRRSGLLAWCLAAGLVVIGCFLGCCLIPFCVDMTKDVQHVCPNCHSVVGTYRPGF